MIFVGTDIVDIARFRVVMGRGKEPFLEKIFTSEEIKYCSGRANPAMHYSGRFAAKEAVKKACLSARSDLIIPLNTIQISRREDGAPWARMDGVLSQFTRVQLSISHTDTTATATALVEVI